MSERSSPVTRMAEDIARFLARHEVSAVALERSDVEHQVQAWAAARPSFSPRDYAAAKRLVLAEAKSTAARTGRSTPATGRSEVSKLDANLLPAIAHLFGDGEARRKSALRRLGVALDLVWARNQGDLLAVRGYALAVFEWIGGDAEQGVLRYQLGPAARVAEDANAQILRHPLDVGLRAEHRAARPRTEPRFTGLLHVARAVAGLTHSLGLTPGQIVGHGSAAVIAESRRLAGWAEIDWQERLRTLRALVAGIPIAQRTDPDDVEEVELSPPERRAPNDATITGW